MVRWSPALTVGLDIRMLLGQTPDDFTAQATAIAYNLGVAEVRVIPLGSSLRTEPFYFSGVLRPDSTRSG